MGTGITAGQGISKVALALEEQTFYNLLNSQEAQVEFKKKMEQFILFGTTAAEIIKMDPDPNEEIQLVEDISKDSSENIKFKIDAFKSKLNLTSGLYIRNVTYNASTMGTAIDGTVVPTTGTHFEYEPDRVPESEKGWAWANTANSASMSRCYHTCSRERWEFIIKTLNNLG